MVGGTFPPQARHLRFHTTETQGGSLDAGPILEGEKQGTRRGDGRTRVGTRTSGFGSMVVRRTRTWFTPWGGPSVAPFIPVQARIRQWNPRNRYLLAAFLVNDWKYSAENTQITPPHCHPESGCEKKMQLKNNETHCLVVITVANSSDPKFCMV